MKMKTVGYNDVVAALKARGCCIGLVKEPKAYHKWKKLLAKEFDCPCVSKSTLADFAESPYRHHWNDERGVKKETASLSLGSAVDSRVLTPGEFARSYVCETINGRTNEGKERKAELEALGIENIPPEKWEVVMACAKVANEALSKEGLKLGKTFQSQVGMWVYMTELGGEELPCPVVVTGMIDICPDEGGKLLDLKTTSADPEDAAKLNFQIEDYHYGLQAALYLDMFALCTGEAREEFEFVFVGTAMPAMCRRVVMSGSLVDLYRRDYSVLLFRYTMAWKQKDWGSALLETVYYEPTRREASRYQRQFLDDMM
ncbi:MAG: PD-(D/E)XK nuclease-like domain-containing protein [Oscillospiraceae bacterium]|nr:PD-(D/E)XK nuclease-like domain-containing protein [Oscillospiraceae bacterium]